MESRGVAASCWFSRIFILVCAIATFCSLFGRSVLFVAATLNEDTENVISASKLFNVELHPALKRSSSQAMSASSSDASSFILSKFDARLDHYMRFFTSPAFNQTVSSSAFVSASPALSFSSPPINSDALRSSIPPQSRAFFSEIINRCANKNSKGRFELTYFDASPFLINQPQLCEGRVDLLIAIHSNPPNAQRRLAIRHSWTSLRQIRGYRIKVFFMLGRIHSAASSQMQRDLEAEADRYSDIVQRAHIESYRNMTIKHLNVLDWTVRHCAHARFLLKSDDDTYVDVFNLVRQLDALGPTLFSNFKFLCSKTVGARPQRRARGNLAKWKVSKEEYAPNSYPPYCEGFGYVVPVRAASALSVCAMFSKFFWIDDVYVTGVLAQKLNFGHLRFPSGGSYKYLSPHDILDANILDHAFYLSWNSQVMNGLWKQMWRKTIEYSMNL